MDQFIYGPLNNESVHICSYINKEFYILKYDKNIIDFPVYFGKMTLNNSKNILFDLNNFKLVTTPGNYKLYNTNENYTILYENGVGNFNIVYDSNQEFNQILYAGINCKMYYNYSIYIFPYKDQEREEIDNRLSEYENYKPYYSGETFNIFFIPVSAYYQSNCNLLGTNVVYLAYAGIKEYQSVYYTRQDICLTGQLFPLCDTNQLCFGCFGPCESGFSCNVADETMKCTTGQESQVPTWLSNFYFIFTILFIFLITILIIYLLIKFRKKPQFEYNYIYQ